MGTTRKKRGSLETQMGRPIKGVLSSFVSPIREYIDKYRPSREGWSAKTIAVELSLDTSMNDQSQPSASSICRYLCSTKRTKRYRRKVDSPPSIFIKTTRAHDVWQIDAEGTKNVSGVGWASPINIKDIETKAYIMSYPCCVPTATNAPKTIDYQWSLRLAFIEWGMPVYLQTDHGSVFYDNKSRSPFPTPLYLWLLGLGIHIVFTPVGKPQKQGMVERSHQTLHDQLTPGIPLSTPDELFDFYQNRRQRLNEHIPASATHNLPPLVNRPDACQPLRIYQSLNENEIFDKNRIQTYLQNQIWFRSVAANKNFSIGGQLYHLPTAKPNSEISVKYNTALDGFDCFDPNGILLDFCPAKKLNFNELAGDINQFNTWIKNRMLLKH
jgi:hypothetical protein